MRMIKKVANKLFFILSLIPAIIVILLTFVSIRLTTGLENEEIKRMLEYLSAFGGKEELLDSDVGFMFYLVNIKTYSHWIFTGCAIWIISILYVYEYKRRLKRGKEKI